MTSQKTLDNKDVGNFKRKFLNKPTNLTLIFKRIRNYLAGTLTGITRDEILAQQIINLLFCKIYDEIQTDPEDLVSFRREINESPRDVKKRINELFMEVKNLYSNIFTRDDKLKLDANAIDYVIMQLQDYSIVDADKDVIRKAFEVFIGPSLRGSEGQFFTPRNVISMCVEIIDPKPTDKIIDPACGSGGFLVSVLVHIWSKLKNEIVRRKWSNEIFYGEINNVLSKCLIGIEKDNFLTKVAKAYMVIIGNGRENIFCENSLDIPKNWRKNTKISVKLGEFDVLFTNPPFGARIKIIKASILHQDDLGYKWVKIGDKLKKSDKLRTNQAPQILFIERCLQFLRKGGKMAIVLPEGILGNPSYEYIRKYIIKNSKILAVVDAPIETFLPYTSTKTCILFLEKGCFKIKDYKIFMAIANKCGHDSRDNIIYKINKSGELLYDEQGNKIIDDDFSIISKRFKQIISGKSTEFNSNGFLVSVSQLRSHILIPRFYDTSIITDLEKLYKKYEMVSIKELTEKGILSIHNGKGVEKKYYGTGDIPYIKTSDIANWELKINPFCSVSEEIYEIFKQELKINDILFVMDGGRLIGNTCLLSAKKDIKLLIQGHFQIFRCEKNNILNPYLLLFLLNTPIVKKQIRANLVVQSSLATIGDRVNDILLPIPKDPELRKKIIEKMKRIIKVRAISKTEIEKISTISLKDI